MRVCVHGRSVFVCVRLCSADVESSRVCVGGFVYVRVGLIEEVRGRKEGKWSCYCIITLARC